MITKKLLGQISGTTVANAAQKNTKNTARKERGDEASAAPPDYHEAIRGPVAYPGSAPKYSASLHAPALRPPQGATSGQGTSRAGGVANQARLSQKAQEVGQKAYNERMDGLKQLTSRQGTSFFEGPGRSMHERATQEAEQAEQAFLKADAYDPKSFAFRTPKQTVHDVWQGQGPGLLVIPKGASKAEKKALTERHREASFQAGEAARADAGVRPLAERSNNKREVNLDLKTPWGQKRYHYPSGEYIRIPGNQHIVDSDPYNDAY